MWLSSVCVWDEDVWVCVALPPVARIVSPFAITLGKYPSSSVTLVKPDGIVALVPVHMKIAVSWVPVSFAALSDCSKPEVLAPLVLESVIDPVSFAYRSSFVVSLPVTFAGLFALSVSLPAVLAFLLFASDDLPINFAAISFVATAFPFNFAYLSSSSKG